jgi:hypothetical protein
MARPQSKVSPGFSARLIRSAPKQKVRALIVLSTSEPEESSSGMRSTRKERQEAIGKIRDSGSQSIKHIDGILARFGGRILFHHPTALGTITIESTPAGIAALSESDSVRAILEDQPISRPF